MFDVSLFVRQAHCASDIVDHFLNGHGAAECAQALDYRPEISVVGGDVRISRHARSLTRIAATGISTRAVLWRAFKPLAAADRSGAAPTLATGSAWALGSRRWTAAK